VQFRNIKEELTVTKIRKEIEREIEEYFERKGFSIIEPRTFQAYDDFIKRNLVQDSTKVVKVLGGDSKIYVLRPDITTSILSQIFSKWEGEPPLKVYYNSKIFKNTPRGVIEQRYQMGIESLGDEVEKADIEIIQMAINILNTLEESYILEMGFSTFLDTLFKEANLDKSDELKVKELISKKNQSELSYMIKSLNLNNQVLANIFNLQGKISDVLDKIKSYDLSIKMKGHITYLENLDQAFTKKGIEDKIRIDLSMIADLDYYDGVIFRGYSSSLPTKLLSGGRYDKSTANYGMKVPAIGFMIDMDLLTRTRLKEVR